MADRSLAVIHCHPGSPWQPKRAAYFAEGFKHIGLPCRITDSRVRLDEGFPVLLGTTFWRDIERDGGEYLLVDRCSFGDTEQFVSLVWNGHGRRGDHKCPSNPSADRWERMGMDLRPWMGGVRRILLCGQTETYSPRYRSLDEWYRTIPATHFRPHPAGDNPTNLPVAQDFSDAIAVTLNSSIAVQSVINGVPAITMDEGSMAWDVTGHDLRDIRRPEREPWAHFLAYTQWHDEEIKEGIPWASLL